MTCSAVHTLLLVGLCTAAVPLPHAFAQAPNPLLVVQNGVKAATESGTPRAKVCDTRGNRSQARVASLWTVTVSSSGGGCGHTRTPTGTRSNVTFGIATAPAHGQITQKPIGPDTVIVYTPQPGYKGPDAFTLSTPGTSVNLPYAVNVVP